MLDLLPILRVQDSGAIYPRSENDWNILFILVTRALEKWNTVLQILLFRFLVSINRYRTITHYQEKEPNNCFPWILYVDNQVISANYYSKFSISCRSVQGYYFMDVIVPMPMLPIIQNSDFSAVEELSAEVRWYPDLLSWPQ